MREIKAIVRQDRLNTVLEALHGLPELPGVTVSVVRGIGRQSSSQPFRVVEFGQTEMAKLEIVVPAAMAAKVVDIIQRSATTGRAGDGKIFVSNIDEAVRIRNGETGGAALS